MNILGMGPMELLLIAILALVVFGPQRLPEIMGQVGKAIADFRRATSGLTDEFNRTLQSELAETKATLESVKQPLQEMQDTLRSPLTTVAAPQLTTPAPPPTSDPHPTVEPIPGAEPPALQSATLERAPAGSETILPPSQAPNGSAESATPWSWETAEATAPRTSETAEATAPRTSDTSKAPPASSAQSGDLQAPY